MNNKNIYWARRHCVFPFSHKYFNCRIFVYFIPIYNLIFSILEGTIKQVVKYFKKYIDS